MPVSIPRRTLENQLAWAENFSLVVSLAPATYNLTLPETATIQAATASFRTEFDLAGVSGRIAVNPGAYTKPGRAALYAAAGICIDTLSAFAVAIQADIAISDMDKIAAGVVPRNFMRAPRNLPAEAPVLQTVGAVPGITVVRGHNGVGTLARPAEANGIEFEFALAVLQSGGGFIVGDWTAYDGAIVANTATIINPSLETAQRIDVRARYYGSRGQRGPWSITLMVGNF